jgi:hypothetical protein
VVALAGERAPRRRPIGEGRVRANVGPAAIATVEEDSGDYPVEWARYSHL